MDKTPAVTLATPAKAMGMAVSRAHLALLMFIRNVTVIASLIVSSNWFPVPDNGQLGEIVPVVCSLRNNGNHPRKYVSHQEYHHANQCGESDAVQEDIAQNAAFITLLAGGDARHHDALCVDHFAHHSACAVGRRRQHRRHAYLPRRNLLQST